MELVGVTGVVEVDVAVGGEEDVKIGVRESVRVRAVAAEDHEVRYVDDADAKMGSDFSEVLSGSDDLKHEVGADAYDDDIRIRTSIRTGEFPDATTAATMGFCFCWGEPNGLGLFGPDNEVDVILRPEAVAEGAEEGVGVGRQVDAGHLRFEVEHGADEGRILVGEAVMFLPGPGGGFDVVDAADIFAPGCFFTKFIEFAVLGHHCMDDTKEGFVGWEDSRTAGQSIALEKA